MKKILHLLQPTKETMLHFSKKWLCCLTHWGWVTHICVSKLTFISSDNGLSPSRCPANIWTNAGISLMEPLVTNFSEVLIKIHTSSLKKMHFKMSSAKWQPFCLGLNVLKINAMNPLQGKVIPLDTYMYNYEVFACLPELVMPPWQKTYTRHEKFYLLTVSAPIRFSSDNLFKCQLFKFLHGRIMPWALTPWSESEEVVDWYWDTCISVWMCKHIEVETKWPLFHRRFLNAFSGMKIYEFWLKIHWSLSN